MKRHWRWISATSVPGPDWILDKVLDIKLSMGMEIAKWSIWAKYADDCYGDGKADFVGIWKHTVVLVMMYVLKKKSTSSFNKHDIILYLDKL